LSPARVLERALLLALCAPACAVAATVCTGSSTSMSLGTYIGDTATPVDSIGMFSLNCTRAGGPQNITINMAIGPSGNNGSIANRVLRSASWPDLLQYNLYRDAARLSVWGQTAGVDTMAAAVSVPNNGSQVASFTIYGRMPGLQDVHAGTYGDTLSVTIDY
jgi:spore coat protein U-like protein